MLCLDLPIDFLDLLEGVAAVTYWIALKRKLSNGVNDRNSSKAHGSDFENVNVGE